jgi:hypothetical protein
MLTIDLNRLKKKTIQISALETRTLRVIGPDLLTYVFLYLFSHPGIQNRFMHTVCFLSSDTLCIQLEYTCMLIISDGTFRFIRAAAVLV